MKLVIIFTVLVLGGCVLSEETGTEKKTRDILFDDLPSANVDPDKEMRDVDEHLGYDAVRVTRETINDPPDYGDIWSNPEVPIAPL